MLPRPVEYYVIRNTDPDGFDFDGNLYWSNADGWVTIDDADTFSVQDTKELLLPMGGEWVLIKGLA
jgi:hypothetical protein